MLRFKGPFVEGQALIPPIVGRLRQTFNQNVRLIFDFGVKTILSHNSAFGKALRSLRHAQKLTQEQLALEAGLDRTYISLLELGQRSPTLDTMVALCVPLHCDLASLMKDTMDKLNELG